MQKMTTAQLVRLPWVGASRALAAAVLSRRNPPMANSKPPADLQISHDLIDSLLKEFVPELAGLPIEFVDAGWDNEMHRIGTDHAVRLPRRKEAAPLIEHEQRWLPELAENLPLTIPAPTHAGRPAFGFPWHWSVVPWIDGVVAGHAPPLKPDTLIDQLTAFLSALHQPAPDDAPINPHRGGPLLDRVDQVAERLVRLDPVFEELGIESAPVQSLWEELAATPEWGDEPVWLHGDLHPMNLLIRGGKVTGVVDFGDITSGDPATDLMVAWMLFPSSDDRNSFRQRSAINGRSIDVHTWKRSRGWALSHATTVLDNSSGDPSMRRMATATLRNVLGKS